jgi:hypothetical protein
MQGNMPSLRKKRAQVPNYVSPSQLTLAGFENPFDQKLDPTNRWVVLDYLIPWDEICNTYFRSAVKRRLRLTADLKFHNIVDSIIHTSSM